MFHELVNTSKKVYWLVSSFFFVTENHGRQTFTAHVDFFFLISLARIYQYYSRYINRHFIHIFSNFMQWYGMRLWWFTIKCSYEIYTLCFWQMKINDLMIWNSVVCYVMIFKEKHHHTKCYEFQTYWSRIIPKLY